MNINYLNFNNTTVFHDGRTPYFSSRALDSIDFIRNGFSTRLGGVSKGIYSKMNLTFTRGDDEAAVKENFKLIGNALSISCEDMVYAKQTHTTNVIAVDESLLGMGVCNDRSYDNVDGLVTNVPGAALVTSHADCVPLYFVDIKKKAIGLSHSGWKGTVNNIAKETIALMQKLYNSKSEDIIAFIGPSICKSCYEIGIDVAEEFACAYGEAVFDDILTPIENKSGKFKLDLHQANYHNILNMGLSEKNIYITDVCTCCNPDLLFSHRASHGERGGMCAFLQIRR